MQATAVSLMLKVSRLAKIRRSVYLAIGFDGEIKIFYGFRMSIAALQS
jgi:hypothetical protein